MKKSGEIVSSAPLYESTRAPQKRKPTPPRCAPCPFQGKGLAWTLPPSYGRRCPEGAEVGWGKRYERERRNASQIDDKREHPIHRCAVPLPRVGKGASGASRIGFWRYERERGGSSQVRRLREHPIHRFSEHNAFPNGEGKEETASPPKKEANSASLRSAAPSKGRGSRGHSLLPVEGGAPKGRRLDGDSGMKERGEIVSSASLYESTLSTAIPISSERIHACVEKQYPRQSLPRVGKVANKASRIGFCRYEREGRSSQVCHYTRAPERRRKRKPTPPRCARQPLPREGARMDAPSFLWKEVPRRGGGWMGEAV